MGYTEQITVEPESLPPKDFTIFTHLPYRVGAEFQKKMIDVGKDVGFDTLRKYSSGAGGKIDLKAEDIADLDIDIDFDRIRDVQELLLKRAVVSPDITEEVLSDDRNELQPYLKPLAEELMGRYQESFKKKRSRPTTS